MTQPYLGEMRIFGFGFAPRNWAFCNGQLLAISQYQALFSILGTTYGGDGIRTFQLPNLEGCVPIHRSGSYVQGTYVGEENHTLTLDEFPKHNHGVLAMTAAASAPTDNGNVLAGAAAGQTMYAPPTSAGQLTLAPQTASTVGGNQAHSNQQPYIVLNMCIALQGIFPSRN